MNLTLVEQDQVVFDTKYEMVVHHLLDIVVKCKYIQLENQMVSLKLTMISLNLAARRFHIVQWSNADYSHFDEFLHMLERDF